MDSHKKHPRPPAPYPVGSRPLLRGPRHLPQVHGLASLAERRRVPDLRPDGRTVPLHPEPLGVQDEHPRKQFSIKVGTIFEDSPLGMEKWLPVVWLIANCKNGISL